MSKSAHILCIAAGRDAFAPKIGFHSFKGSVDDAVKGDLWVGPRPLLETMRPLAKNASINMSADSILDTLISAASSILDGNSEDQIDYPPFVQIIPYILFRYNGKYLRYLRPDKGNEARLHGKISIGIGGHIDFIDIEAAQDGSIDLPMTLAVNAQRESKEEIGLDLPLDGFRWVATLYSNALEVDTVHLGVVGIIDLTKEQAKSVQINDEISDHSFETLADIIAEVEADETKSLETWTRLIIESNPLG